MTSGGRRSRFRILADRFRGVGSDGSIKFADLNILVQWMMAFDQIPKKDWYSILGASPSASMSDLKQKYQKLILMYHPDKQSADVPAGTVEECIRKFIEIDQAWKILGNEETKKEYDLQRHGIHTTEQREAFSASEQETSETEDNLRNMGPVDAQVYLEEMSWNEDDHSFSVSCRCGGEYSVSKEEAEEVTLISCDTCSLIIELLHYS
ncbi:dnaJ homolog subfamily C member 24 isoform X2 [Pteropus alecto]|uniref:DnaJ homolog subfamily C member 24 n=1 Tax=Pteropus vampyrus TaxID=132908 RepID=A0A6P6CLH9_PTEVA|nr:dnaJ homolog subfamily C member 24 isoform X1 [Pteropus vampyrus]XP_024899918.1 dnaJ homolog subfamily C member 24 isoform X2 [Pteropus alecto]